MSTSTVVEKFDLNDHYMVLNPSKDFPIKITPMPTPDLLGINNYGKSFLTEIFPYNCPCGLELGLFAKDMSASMLNKENFNDICLKYGLNGCCRMRFLGPYILPVVSSDLSVLQMDDRYENLKMPDFRIYKF